MMCEPYLGTNRPFDNHQHFEYNGEMNSSNIRPGLDQFTLFIAIAERRSFRAAAKALGLSPSAVSHSIRALEERLGVRLFERTTRSVALTAAGQALLNRLGPALREIDHAVDAARAFGEAPRGDLRINTPATAARLCLEPLVPRFLRAYPGVRFEIVTNDELADIVAAGCHAGVRLGEQLDGDMIAVPLGGAQRFAVVAAPDYLAKHGVPRSPDELSGHALLARRFPGGNVYDWEFEKDGREMRVRPAGPLVVDRPDTAIAAACDGAGIAIVMEGLVEDEIEAGRLTRILEDWCAPFDGFYLYYPGRRQVPPQLRAFVDFVRANAGSANNAARRFVAPGA